MTYEFVELTSQAAMAHWGWTIAFFLWFVGLAGMSLFLNWWLRSKRVFYVATADAIVGTLLVVSHLARMLNLPMASPYHPARQHCKHAVTQGTQPLL